MFLGLDCWGSLKQSIRVSFGFLEDGPSLRLGDVSLDVYCLGFRVWRYMQGFKASHEASLKWSLWRIYQSFFSLQGSFKGWGPLSSFSSRVVTTVLSGSPLQAFRILVIRDLGDGFAV